METLSPMPPVECLSTLGREMADVSMTSPVWSMVSVRAAISAGVMPLK